MKLKVCTRWPAIFEMKIQEQFKNISSLFKNTSDVENTITIDLKDFFKKFNHIITKDKYKYQQQQNYEYLSIVK